MAGTIGRITEFVKELRNELRKVSWPDRKEVEGATVVILITVFAFGFYLGVVDLIFGHGLPSSPLNTWAWSLAALGLLVLIGYLLVITTRG